MLLLYHQYNCSWLPPVIALMTPSREPHHNQLQLRFDSHLSKGRCVVESFWHPEDQAEVHMFEGAGGGCPLQTGSRRLLYDHSQYLRQQRRQARTCGWSSRGPPNLHLNTPQFDTQTDYCKYGSTWNETQQLWWKKCFYVYLCLAGWHKVVEWRYQRELGDFMFPVLRDTRENSKDTCPVC